MQCFLVIALAVGLASAGDVVREQRPGVWDALADLRGEELTTEEIQDLFQNAIPDKDFPVLEEIPDDSDVDCSKFHQPEFYASEKYRCQVFHRCDINGNLKNYLCPKMTVSLI